MEKNKILMIVIIALLVLLLGAIVFLGFSFMRYMNNSSQEKEQQAEAEANAAVILTPDQLQLVSLSSKITANLRPGTDGLDTHVASVGLSIGVDNTQKKESPIIITTLTEKETIVMDICLGVIRDKTYEELKRQDGPDIMRQDILSRLRDEFQSGLIYQVYIDALYIE